MYAERIPLGVTVRHLKFIEDISTEAHPMFVLLVSKEVCVKDSLRNTNEGLTPEQVLARQKEREAEKTRKQVEADLSGGFEFESEWVEEIEREDCFDVKLEYGGVPPVYKPMHAVWLVDAGSSSSSLSSLWNIVDSHALGEFEHGLTLEVMSLSAVNELPGSTTTTTAAAAAVSANIDDGNNDENKKELFVTVGTGIVDQDGEDVGSKGRVLLFSPSARRDDLSLVYEKDILHGPVTSLSCLTTSGGRTRIVIGAGADVNVEQWGNDKLTQVGFFRAQMHIQAISLFKNFLLLSDAYDSLYFLVWRESDKSLTLLAKDYEPVAVYAAGWINRGGSMAFLCHDDRQNLQFFQYSPGDAAARGGNKLVARADVHLGSVTVAFNSHWCKPSLLVDSATPTSTLAALKQQDGLFGRSDEDLRFGLHFGTSDGALLAVVPLSEQVFWRFLALQSVVGNALPSPCSLSYKAWRLYRRSPRRGGCRSNDRKKGVIDGDLVCKFTNLSLAQQEDLAGAIGTSVDQIVDHLVELQSSSCIL
mmetsp:Transcript_24583/g.37919  ORF Transcript_24583/g.37919 Transcript_24583/m.37919 type:complete len:532 (-) Transcript_24583:18-1613(-)